MIRKSFIAVLAATLAGAAQAQDVPVSPAAVPAPVEDGRTFRTTDVSGLELSTVYLDAGGALRIQEETLGLKYSGRWFRRDGYVCTEFKQNGRECWALDLDAPRGLENRLVSDRGRTIKFTRL
ncbi:MAG: hypothetical protein WDN24_02750 [Sphingomonas sp.]